MLLIFFADNFDSVAYEHIFYTTEFVSSRYLITVVIHLRYFLISGISFNIRFNYITILVTTQGNPPPPIPTMPPVPIMKNLSISFQCNFDLNICGMKQDKTDKADYILHRGRTPNRNTGPSRDHTSGRGKVLLSLNASSVLHLFSFRQIPLF